MEATRFVAPFAVAALVTTGLTGTATLTSIPSTALSTATTHLSASVSDLGPSIQDAIEGLTSGWQPWWGVGPVMPPDFVSSPISLPGVNSQLSQLITIVGQLLGSNTDLNQALADGFQTVISEVSHGATLTQALSDASAQIVDAVGGTAGQLIQSGIEALSHVVSLAENIAPAVLSGVHAVAAALPGAVSPIVDAVTQAMRDVTAALSSGNLPHTVATALAGIAGAVENGIQTMEPVVKSAWQGIQDAAAGDHLLCGSCFNPAPAASAKSAGAKSAGAVVAASDGAADVSDARVASDGVTSKPSRATGGSHAVSGRSQHGHAAGRSKGSSVR